ncbi:MAG: hypothetical protein EAX96_02400 [Candidatus Lokiarchaeota archaeon]|nr:hypothetical protein [Candidatus Lokiarchaeota archaeon]
MGFFDKLKKNIEYNIKSSVRGTVARQQQQVKHQVKTGLKSSVKQFALNMKKQVMNTTSVGDYNSFKKRWETDGKNHVQTIFLYLLAALEYTTGNQQVGEAMATLVLPKPRLLVSKSSPSGYITNPKGEGYLLNHMKENPRVVPSYIGGSPDDNYQIDPNNLQMTVLEEGVSGREAVVVIQSAGKDFPTPCGLRMNNAGYWKIFKGTGSIATGAQVTEEEKWDF